MCARENQAAIQQEPKVFSFLGVCHLLLELSINRNRVNSPTEKKVTNT